MNRKRRRINVAIVIALALALVAVLASCSVIAGEAKGEEKAFVKDSEIKIAHLTDIHYYPLNYCYKAGNPEKAAAEIPGSDYEVKLYTGTKPLPENSRINMKALEMMMKPEVELDYLFVTGDTTYDGELQSHIEVANLLREFQNAKREQNPRFQVFVTMGNHDMYNIDAEHFRDAAKSSPTGHLVSRADIVKIYAGLGFPNLTNDEMKAYYDSLTSGFFTDELPYKPISADMPFVNSENHADISFKYQYDHFPAEISDLTLDDGRQDYVSGMISYIAYVDIKDDGGKPRNDVILGFEEELSNAVVNHHVGGKVFRHTREFYRANKASFEGKNVYSLMHHNAVPHFDGADTLLKDFPIYGWRDTVDFVSELGGYYTFTGHMHANDVATAEAFYTGKKVTDIESSALIGIHGGVRYIRIERGTYDGQYATNLYVKTDVIKEPDFILDISKLVDEGYLHQDYFKFHLVEKYVDQESQPGKTLVTNNSMYIGTKVFLSIIEMLEYRYLTPEFINGAGQMVQDMLEGKDLPSIISTLPGIAKDAIDAIVKHLENVVLADYEYSGPYDQYKGKGPGKKLSGYASELVRRVANHPVTDDGSLTLFEFGMDQYLGHLQGTDKKPEELTAAERNAFENLKNGKTLHELFDMLLDKKSGIYRIIEGLTLPIDFSGMPQESQDTLIGLLDLGKPSPDFVSDPKAIKLDNYAGKLVDIAAGLMGKSISLEGKTIMGFLNGVIDGYVTDAFYKSLGVIAHDILWAFGVDPTASIEGTTSEETWYRYDESMPVTHYATAPADEPSIENGKLPGMMTVTFGRDPKTMKNFVWFTDPRLTDGQIQYMEGDKFDAAKAKAVDATVEITETTTASIDLGVWASLMHVDVARYNVKLINLKPGTTYSYRVGSAANGWFSPVYKFKTAPEEGQAFDLMLISDIQASALNVYEDAKKALGHADGVFENGYDFMINCGDVVDNGKNQLQWKYFLNTLQQELGNTSQVVAAGNHEKGIYESPDPDKKIKKMYPLSYTSKYSSVIDHKSELMTFESDLKTESPAYNYFDLYYDYDNPDMTASKGGTYYSFDYSSVHFTVLNTNDFEGSEFSEEQLAWLKNDLKNTKMANKVVVMHKGIFTAGSHAEQADVAKLRELLPPIFAENGVNLVLQGHDHTYSESYYLDGSGEKIDSDAQGKSEVGSEGTLYVTLGTLGDKRYEWNDAYEDKLEFGKDIHSTRLQNPTFGKLSFDGSKLSYEGYECDLENGGKITPVRALVKKGGLLWWHWLLIALAICAVIAAIVTTVIVVKKKGAKAK